MALSEAALGVGSWIVCSIGMMVFNKLAVTALPFGCTLVAMQMAFCVFAMLVFCGPSLHVGSMRDILKWCLVVPLYAGMLLTSVLALKNAPMTLVITLRGLSPMLSLFIERFYPEPIRVTPGMVASIFAMLIGTAFYISEINKNEDWSGALWAVANMFFAVGDRSLQRLLLAKNQCPVDMSKTAITLVNNLAGGLLMIVAAWLHGELGEAKGTLASMDIWSAMAVAFSCVVGVGISYTGIWAQSLISATSFLVLVNVNKFVIIILELLVMHTSLGPRQIIGALLTIAGGAAYGKVRELLEVQQSKARESERQPLVKDESCTAKSA